ncbi:MAG TPA: complex I NDUFA9 subunit family protein [Nevskiales bacterium]|nr:complex I NDUFA9 subunit family protein [Nevskiales bacterium]
MKIETICVLGGTGFVGSHLVPRLYDLGYQVRVLTRNRERHRELSVLPRVELIQVADFGSETLAAQFAGCQVVINLIGILNGSADEFHRVHAELPRRVVEACASAGVGRCLHMSALNADAVHGPSLYLKSKGEGELGALAEGAARGVAVTAFRPSIMFGPDDHFFNRFAGLLKFAPVLPLACPNTRFAPVYVGDVVEAFVAALDDPASHGQSYELCGPRSYTFRELVEYTAVETGRCRYKIVGLPDALARLQAVIMEKLPGQPFSLDNYRSLQVDNVCHGGPGLAQLGITPHSVEAIMGPHLRGLAGRRHYDRYRQVARRD